MKTILAPRLNLDFFFSISKRCVCSRMNQSGPHYHGIQSKNISITGRICDIHVNLRRHPSIFSRCIVNLDELRDFTECAAYLIRYCFDGFLYYSSLPCRKCQDCAGLGNRSSRQGRARQEPVTPESWPEVEA